VIAFVAFFLAQALAPSPSATATASATPSATGVPASATGVPASATSAPTPATMPQPSPIQPIASPSAPAAGTSATPLPAPTSTTTPSPYTYRFVPRQPDHAAPGTPQIFAVYLNSKDLRSNGPILIKVVTSPDAVKVVSKNGSSEGVVPQISPGDFEATSRLPKLPFIAQGMTIFIDFVATGPTGLPTTVRVPVKLD